MEITGADMARLCKVSPACISALAAKGKLHKTESSKYSVFDPINKRYLSDHGIKGSAAVEKYLNSAEKRKKRPGKPKKNPVPQQKEEDESIKLLDCLEKVISKEYSKNEGARIKNLVFREFVS